MENMRRKVGEIVGEMGTYPGETQGSEEGVGGRRGVRGVVTYWV